MGVYRLSFALPILLFYLLFAPKRAVVAEVASQKHQLNLRKKILCILSDCLYWQDL